MRIGLLLSLRAAAHNPACIALLLASEQPGIGAQSSKAVAPYSECEIHETGLAVLRRTTTDLLIRDRVGDPRVRTVIDLGGNFPAAGGGKDQVPREEAAITVGSTASASIRRPLTFNLPLMPRVHPNFIPRPVLRLKTGSARFEHDRSLSPGIAT